MAPDFEPGLTHFVTNKTAILQADSEHNYNNKSYKDLDFYPDTDPFFLESRHYHIGCQSFNGSVIGSEIISLDHEDGLSAIWTALKKIFNRRKAELPTRILEIFIDPDTLFNCENSASDYLFSFPIPAYGWDYYCTASNPGFDDDSDWTYDVDTWGKFTTGRFWRLDLNNITFENLTSMRGMFKNFAGCPGNVKDWTFGTPGANAGNLEIPMAFPGEYRDVCVINFSKKIDTSHVTDFSEFLMNNPTTWATYLMGEVRPIFGPQFQSGNFNPDNTFNYGYMVDDVKFVDIGDEC